MKTLVNCHTIAPCGSMGSNTQHESIVLVYSTNEARVTEITESSSKTESTNPCRRMAGNSKGKWRNVKTLKDCERSKQNLLVCSKHALLMRTLYQFCLSSTRTRRAGSNPALPTNFMSAWRNKTQQTALVVVKLLNIMRQSSPGCRVQFSAALTLSANHPPSFSQAEFFPFAAWEWVVGFFPFYENQNR